MKFFPLLAFILSCSAFAAPAKTAKPQNRVLWSQWYTITDNNEPHMYVFEEAELRPKEKQIAISQRYWEKTASGVKQYYIGSVANDNAPLTPIAFFVERNNPPTKVDGRVKQGTLSVKTSGGGAIAKKLNMSLEKNTIFSNFLAMYLARQTKQKPAESIFYSVVLEDGYGGVYQLDSGTAVPAKDTKKINGELCSRIENSFQGISTTWWITEQGKICRISVPSFGRTQEAVSEKEALNFLDK